MVDYLSVPLKDSLPRRSVGALATIETFQVIGMHSVRVLLLNFVVASFRDSHHLRTDEAQTTLDMSRAWVTVTKKQLPAD